MSRVTSEPVGEGAPSVQTLDRGIRVVRLLAAAPDGLTATELARSLGVHRAVVYRLLGTLTAHGLVLRGADGRYRPWLGLVELARGVSARWGAVAGPVLEQLAADVGATAVLSVAHGDDCVALLVAEPRDTVLHVAYRPGLRHPLGIGASGKAILAGRPPAPGEDAGRRRRPRTRRRNEPWRAPGGSGRRRGADRRRGALRRASVGVVSLAELDEHATALVADAAAASPRWCRSARPGSQRDTGRRRSTRRAADGVVRSRGTVPTREPEPVGRRRRGSSSAGLTLAPDLGRFVCPASLVEAITSPERALSVVLDGPLPEDPRIEAVEARRPDDPATLVGMAGEVYVELPLDDALEDRLAELAPARPVRQGPLWGRVDTGVSELASFVRACRELGLAFKATAGLHHALPVAGEHGFLNLLAAVMFGDEEEALADEDATAFGSTTSRFGGATGRPERRTVDLARRGLLRSIGSCSFFEPVAELEALGITPP